MYDIKIDRRSLGLNFNESGNACLTVWAPFANRIEVEVNGGQVIRMNPAGFGYWDLETDHIKKGDRYYIKLDGGEKYPDPASLSQPEGVHGPSKAIDLQNFPWKDKEWKAAGLDDMVIYELHTGSFSREGTFQGVINKLDYLIELGITAIEIMPVSQFPGARNWGYDGVFVYAVQNSYGGANGLQELVQACHARGISVIMDVVYNHNGPEGNYLPIFGPYFTDKYRIPWGKAVNYDDAYNYGVRQYYIENALMWFRDFHIDALRLDAIHAIRDFSTRHILAELSENVKRLNQETGSKHLLIGECDLNDVKYIDPVEKRGYGLDAQWCDEFHHALHAFVTGERLEYYADFGGIEHIAKSIQDAFVYDGKYSPHRKKVFGAPLGDRSGNQFVVFIQNHDQVGNRRLGERLSELVGFEMLKLLAGTMFLSPYIPLIFMGEEYGELHPFLYFNSHEDPDLIRRVREGRKNEFREFYGKGEPADPQAIETFNRSKLSWNYLNREWQNDLFRYYKELIRLKKHHPLLKSRNRKNLDVKIEKDKKIIYIDRTEMNRKVTGILNLEDHPENIYPGESNLEEMHLILYSGASSWGGPVSEDQVPDIMVPGQIIQGHSLIIFSN